MFSSKKLSADEDQQQSSGKSTRLKDTQVEFFLHRIAKIDFRLTGIDYST